MSNEQIFYRLTGNQGEVVSVDCIGKHYCPDQDFYINFASGEGSVITKDALFDAFWVSRCMVGQDHSWLVSLAVATGVPCRYTRRYGMDQYLLLVAFPDGRVESMKPDGEEYVSELRPPSVLEKEKVYVDRVLFDQLHQAFNEEKVKEKFWQLPWWKKIIICFQKQKTFY